MKELKVYEVQFRKKKMRIRAENLQNALIAANSESKRLKLGRVLTIKSLNLILLR